MNKKKFLCKILSFAIMLCILCTLIGCEDNYSNKQLRGDSDGELSYRCAFSAETSEFQKNDVILIFYFGDQFSSGFENEPVVPYLDLYFYSTRDSIEYKKHSEVLTIPKELFLGDKGIISFSINSQLESDIEDVSLSVVQIHYKVNGEIVLLSNEHIK